MTLSLFRIGERGSSLAWRIVLCIIMAIGDHRAVGRLITCKHGGLESVVVFAALRVGVRSFVQEHIY
jgi:hypothetical protein